jgi:cytochrome b subunit of formate dehydrogenase
MKIKFVYIAMVLLLLTLAATGTVIGTQYVSAYTHSSHGHYTGCTIQSGDMILHHNR